VLDLRLAQIVKLLLPPTDLVQDTCNRARYQNVAGVAAVHHALRDVDAAPCHIERGVDVLNAVNRPGMDAHPQLDFGRTTQHLTMFEGALGRPFRPPEKHQRQAVTGGETDQLIPRLRLAERARATHRLLQAGQHSVLLIRRKLRVRHNVHEEHISHLQLCRPARIKSGRGLLGERLSGGRSGVSLGAGSPSPECFIRQPAPRETAAHYATPSAEGEEHGPLRPEFKESFRLIREHSTTPIAMGELLNSLWNCLPLIKEQWIGYMRCDLGHIGGITVARKVATGGAVPSEDGVARPRWHRPAQKIAASNLRWALPPRRSSRTCIRIESSFMIVSPVDPSRNIQPKLSAVSSRLPASHGRLARGSDSWPRWPHHKGGSHAVQGFSHDAKRCAQARQCLDAQRGILGH